MTLTDWVEFGKLFGFAGIVAAGIALAFWRYLQNQTKIQEERITALLTAQDAAIKQQKIESQAALDAQREENKLRQKMIDDITREANEKSSMLLQKLLEKQEQRREDFSENRLGFDDMQKITRLAQISIDQMRKDINATKVLLFRFHNGTKDMSGFPLEYFTLFMFSPEGGLSLEEVRQLRQIPTGMAPNLCEILSKKKIYSVPNFQEVNVKERFLIRDAPRSIVVVGLFPPATNNPLGFLVVLWEDKPLAFIYSQYITRIQVSAGEIQGLFALNSEQLNQMPVKDQK